MSRDVTGIVTQEPVKSIAIVTIQFLLIKGSKFMMGARDPFDRMLMAQDELENLPIITYDSVFKTGFI